MLNSTLRYWWKNNKNQAQSTINEIYTEIYKAISYNLSMLDMEKGWKGCGREQKVSQMWSVRGQWSETRRNPGFIGSASQETA